MAWYICLYLTDKNLRWPEVADHNVEWSGSEVLGDRCIVKVDADAAMLKTLDGLLHYRLPKDELTDSLGDLLPTVIAELETKLLEMGYTLLEIAEAFPLGLGNHTLQDYLDFAATRRLKPRYDDKSDTIFVDGKVENCRPILDVDKDITIGVR